MNKDHHIVIFIKLTYRTWIKVPLTSYIPRLVFRYKKTIQTNFFSCTSNASGRYTCSIIHTHVHDSRTLLY